MKKSLLIFAFFLAANIEGYSQGAKLGVSAGAVFSNYSFKASGFTMSAKSRAGFTAGLVADIKAGKTFSIQPAAHFIQYGTTSELSDGGSEKSELRVNALEVPLNFIYNIPAEKGRIFIGAGPSIAFHLSGKTKDSDGNNVISEEKLDFGSTETDDMKSINFGANFLAGYVLGNGLFFSVNYNLGLKNLEPVSEDGISSKCHYFGVRIGYFFGKN